MYRLSMKQNKHGGSMHVTHLKAFCNLHVFLSAVLPARARWKPHTDERVQTAATDDVTRATGHEAALYIRRLSQTFQ